MRIKRIIYILKNNSLNTHSPNGLEHNYTQWTKAHCKDVKVFEDEHRLNSKRLKNLSILKFQWTKKWNASTTVGK